MCSRCVWPLPDSLVIHSSPPLGICWLLHTLSSSAPLKLSFFFLPEPKKAAKMRGLVVLATLACFAAAQHQALIDYLEQRLLGIEVRLSFLFPAGALRSRIQNKKKGGVGGGIFSGTRHETWNVDLGKMLEEFS